MGQSREESKGPSLKRRMTIQQSRGASGEELLIDPEQTSKRKIFSKNLDDMRLPDDFDQQIQDFETKIKRGEVSQYTLHSLLELYNQAIEYHTKKNEKTEADKFNAKIQQLFQNT